MAAEEAPGLDVDALVEENRTELEDERDRHRKRYQCS